jgi:hypothetical protein
MSFITHKTTAEWQEIWIAKLEKACIEKGLTKPAIANPSPTIIEIFNDEALKFDTGRRYLIKRACSV